MPSYSFISRYTDIITCGYSLLIIVNLKKKRKLTVEILK